MTEHGSNHENDHAHESTHASNEWLKTGYNRLAHLAGDIGLTGAGEYFTALGSGSISEGVKTLGQETLVAGVGGTVIKDSLVNVLKENFHYVIPASLSVITGNPLPLLLGAIPSFLGTVIGWQGVKNSKSRLEQAAFLAIKGANAASDLFAPAVRPILTGLSIASTAIGMRNRK